MITTLRFIIVCSMLLAACLSNAQEFDVRLEKLAKSISDKISSSKKKKIAVWGFVSESGIENSTLGNYLNEDFSVYITNFRNNFDIIDRNHLDIILKEHKLNADGYIDEQTAKELGKIAAVDAIVIGTYSLFPTRVKVRVKVLDTETANQFAANIADLPIHKELRDYLKLDPVSANKPPSSKNAEKNPDSSIATKRVTITQVADTYCKKGKYGFVCFKNTSTEKVAILIRYYQNMMQRRKHTLVEAGDKVCFTRISGDVMVKYYVATASEFSSKFRGNFNNMSKSTNSSLLKDIGELKVETCKSKLVTIK